MRCVALLALFSPVHMASMSCGSIAADYDAQCCTGADDDIATVHFTGPIYTSEPHDGMGSGKVAKDLFTSAAGRALGLDAVEYAGPFPSVLSKGFADVTTGKAPVAVLALVYLPWTEFVGVPRPIPAGTNAYGYLFLDGVADDGTSPEPAGDHIASLYELPGSTPDDFRPGPLLDFYQAKLDARADALGQDRVLLFPLARNPGSGLGFSSRPIEVDETSGTLDLSWMNARVSGDLGNFLKRFGATQKGGISGSAIVSKLEEGAINFAEFNNPYMNERVGLHNQSVAPLYYRDNIQEYTSIYFAFVNARWWSHIGEEKRRAFHAERRARMQAGYEEALSQIQGILDGLEARGIAVRTLSPATRAAMKAEWTRYVADRTNSSHSLYDPDWVAVYDIIYGTGR